MKFKDVELLPGVIIESNDPKRLGRVKVTVPGLFDDSIMNKEGMPWVYPLTMFGYQNFTKLQNGSKVWVFKQENNYREFWYLPMFELNTDTREIVTNAYDEPDVLVCRSAGANSVKMYYNDVDGIMFQMGENNIINMKSNGEILLKSGNAQVSLKNDKVYIGDNNVQEEAVLGIQIEKLLNNLKINIDALSNAASGNPYTSILVPQLNTLSQSLDSDIKTIKAKNTLVS